jgi:glycosyltransferase involved in cell wall biosynthesis
MAKVSVCIPTYNTALYLGTAIDCVLQQEFSDYELIICDNASTDNTPQVCRSYDDPRVCYVRFDEFVGQASNWNRCLSLARGEYVVILHADDVLQPAFLKRAVAELENNPAVGLVHCSVQHIDASGLPLHLQQLYSEDRVDSGDVLLRRLLLDGCVVNPAGVLVRRSVYESVGPFTERIVWGVDWHMWMRIALCSRVAYLAAPLACYRQHPQSGTSGVMATARYCSDEIWMMNDIFDQITPTRTDLHSLRSEAIRQVAHRTWCFAEDMCRRGLMPAARVGIRKAVGINPGMLFEGRTWTLWAATYFGYGFFKGLHSLKRRILHERAAPYLAGKL